MHDLFNTPLTFGKVNVGETFVITDQRAPAYMQGVDLVRITPYQDPASRITANAERVNKRGDHYDFVWVNGEYNVQVTGWAL